MMQTIPGVEHRLTQVQLGVRQKANAFGEVVDEYGTVVGRVQTLQRPQESPILRMSSPIPFSQPSTIYEQPHLQQYRRESVNSQPEVFTPAWQQMTRVGQSMFSTELRNHLATVAQEDQQPVLPFDLQGKVTALELDAGSTEQADDRLPIFDISDYYLPAPYVQPELSHGTPSPSSLRPTSIIEPRPKRTTQAVQRDLTTQLTDSEEHAAQQQQHEQASADFPMRAQQGSFSDSSSITQDKSCVSRTITVAPEDSNTAPEQAQASNAYSYRGAIPPRNERPPTSRSAAPRPRAKSPSSSFRLQTTSSNSPHGLIAASQYTPSGTVNAQGVPLRKFSTGVPGPRPNFAHKNSYHAPLRKSPLSSQGMSFTHRSH
jgi:hypothetical protein